MKKFVLIFATFIFSSELCLSRDLCANSFLPTPPQTDSKLRKQVFRRKGIEEIPASGVYYHQVLGLKTAERFNKKDWHDRFTSQLSRSDFSLLDFQTQLLSSSYQDVLWATRKTLFSPDDRNAILVKLTFKKTAVFVDQYSARTFHDLPAAIDKFGIVGLHDKANDFYKILSLRDLKSIEIVDAENSVRVERQF